MSSGGWTRRAAHLYGDGVMFTQRRPGITAAVLVCSHVSVALFLARGALSQSAQIFGRDALYRLGPAPAMDIAGACLPVPLRATAAFVLTIGRTPQHLRLAPVRGISASVLLTGLALAFLHAPEPIHGD